jgi:hypothetical protein
MNSVSNNPQSYYAESGRPNGWSQEDNTNSFVPTAVQIQRANELKRFNRLVIYLPLGLLATAVLGLLIYLLILAIWPPFQDTRLFISGIADIILILFVLPVVLIFGLLLVGIFGGAIYWRQSRKDEGEPSLQQKYGRFRLLLWKVDQKLSGVYRQIDQLMPKLADPIVKFNATMTYINTRLARLTSRSNNR